MVNLRELHIVALKLELTTWTVCIGHISCLLLSLEEFRKYFISI